MCEIMTQRERERDDFIDIDRHPLAVCTCLRIGERENETGIYRESPHFKSNVTVTQLLEMLLIWC